MEKWKEKLDEFLFNVECGLDWLGEKMFDESNGRTAWATVILRLLAIAASTAAILLTISKR